MAGLMPISMGLSGIIADALNQNIPQIYAICGIITVLLSALTSFNPNFISFLRYVDFLKRDIYFCIAASPR